MINTIINIPINKEKEIQNIFLSTYDEEIKYFDEISKIYLDYLAALKHKNSSTNKLEYTIEHLLGYVLGLCFSSFSSLSQGYLNSSQIILRAAIENLVWAMYLFEFPEDIDLSEDFRDLSKKIGKLKNLKTGEKYKVWIEGALERIDAECTKLLVTDEWGWKRRIFDSICEEANHFVHTDFKIIEALITVQEDGKVYKIAGPINLKNELLAKNGIWKLIEVMLLSLVVFSKAFTKEIDVVKVTQQEQEKVTEIVKKLNQHKEKYNEPK